MKKLFLLLMLSGGTLITNAQEWKSTGDNSTTGKVTAKEYTFPRVHYDFSKEPRTQIGSMSIKLFDDYVTHRPGGNSPDNNSYGTLLAMYGYSNHWESNIYFGASTKKMYFRTSTWSGGTSENGTTGGFHDWRTLLDNKSDVKSSGLLKMEGNGTHYFSKGNVGIGVTETKGRLHVNGSIYANMGEGFKIYGDANYFGEYLDAIIFQMEDSNSSNGNTDGGFVFRGFTPKDGKFNDWMTIKTGGNVGIGTLTPNSTLSVEGKVSSKLMELKVKNTSTSWKDQITIKGDMDSPYGIAFIGNGHHRGGLYAENIPSGGDGNITLWSRANGQIYLDSKKTELKGNMKLDNSTSEHTNIQIGHDINDRIFADNSAAEHYGGGIFFRVTPDPSLNISHNYIDVMMLTDKGTVGIGTKGTGSHKLAVEGSIGAREIKVETTSWADFVFEEDYDLPTLKEVEKHIEEKGHLENIPSAEEVKKDGFFLGEMDAKLLRKIEELMLYTIEQEKELKKQEVRAKNQQEKMEQLEKENVVLKNRLDKIEELLKKLKNN